MGGLSRISRYLEIIKYFSKEISKAMQRLVSVIKAGLVFQVSILVLLPRSINNHLTISAVLTFPNFPNINISPGPILYVFYANIAFNADIRSRIYVR